MLRRSKLIITSLFILLITTSPVMVFAQSQPTPVPATGQVKGDFDIFGGLVNFFRSIPTIGSYIPAEQKCAEELDVTDTKPGGDAYMIFDKILKSQDSDNTRIQGLAHCAGEVKQAYGTARVKFHASRSESLWDIFQVFFSDPFSFKGTQMGGDTPVTNAQINQDTVCDSASSYLDGCRDPKKLQEWSRIPDLPPGNEKDALVAEKFKYCGAYCKLQTLGKRRYDPPYSIDRGGYDLTSNVDRQKLDACVMRRYVCSLRGWYPGGPGTTKNAKFDDTTPICGAELCEEKSAGWLFPAGYSEGQDPPGNVAQLDTWFQLEKPDPHQFKAIRPALASEFTCTNKDRTSVLGPEYEADVNYICDNVLGVLPDNQPLVPGKLFYNVFNVNGFKPLKPCHEQCNYRPQGPWQLGFQDLKAEDYNISVKLIEPQTYENPPANVINFIKRAFFGDAEQERKMTISLGRSNEALAETDDLIEPKGVIDYRRTHKSEFNSSTNNQLGSRITSPIGGFEYNENSEVVAGWNRQPGQTRGATTTNGDVLGEIEPLPSPKIDHTFSADIEAEVTYPAALQQLCTRAKYVRNNFLPFGNVDQINTTNVNGDPVANLPAKGPAVLTAKDFDLLEGQLPLPCLGSSNVLTIHQGSAQKSEPPSYMVQGFLPYGYVPKQSISGWVHDLAQKQAQEEFAAEIWQSLSSFNQTAQK